VTLKATDYVEAYDVATAMTLTWISFITVCGDDRFF